MRAIGFKLDRTFKCARCALGMLPGVQLFADDEEAQVLLIYAIKKMKDVNQS